MSNSINELLEEINKEINDNKLIDYIKTKTFSYDDLKEAWEVAKYFNSISKEKRDKIFNKVDAVA